MLAINRQVLDAAGLPPEAARLSRIWECFVVAGVILLFMGVIHLHILLTVGDWDMFIDWKDRQYWVLVTPVSMIMIPAALQAVFWHYFRLPIGATVGAVVLILATWITRYVGWHLWGYFPFSMSIPATMLASALALDATLLIVRNGILTATFGGFLFALMFYPSNYASLAPYYVPIEHQGMIATAADMIGYVFPRSATPEYIRMIERGTLRTFEGTSVWVSTAFAGFICIFMHMIWWRVGLAFSTQRFIPNAKGVKAMMGFRDEERVAKTV